jgi:hypothetical protein
MAAKAKVRWSAGMEELLVVVATTFLPLYISDKNFWKARIARISPEISRVGNRIV